VNRLLSGGILSAVIALGLTAGANAQHSDVQFSGGVYSKAACGVVVGHAARCHARIVSDRAGNLIATDGHPPVGGLGPTDLRDAYKITAQGSASTVIAIVDAFGYDNAEVDLGIYRANFGLPECTTANGCFKKLNQNGKQKKYPEQNIGWAQESALDLDMASAMCPNCKIWLVESKNNSLKNLSIAVTKAGELGAHVISNSYGGGDGKGTATYEPAYDQPGVAVTVSSGDDGYGTQFPASSNHVIAVGGTRLIHASNDRGWSETAWGGAGSGCTKRYAKPAWQSDPDCAMRTIADVSAVSDPGTGVAVYGPGQNGVSHWMIFGGTSVAAPLIGGIYGANGGTVNYGADPYSHTANLFDVTSGSNGACDGSYLCTAGPGYDGPTGLGTPNGIDAF
jgi:subtilase family serine protease